MAKNFNKKAVVNKNGNGTKLSSTFNKNGRNRQSKYKKGDTSDLVINTSSNSLASALESLKEVVNVGSFSYNLHEGWENGVRHWNDVGASSIPKRIDDPTGKGLMAEISYAPLIGTTSSVAAINVVEEFGANAFVPTSPVNQCCVHLKMYMDTQLGARRDYSSADIAPYLMAVKSAIRLATEIKRDIAIVNTQYTYPGTSPDGLYYALGIASNYVHSWSEYGDKDGVTYPNKELEGVQTSKSIAREQALMVDQLNTNIDLLNTLAIPADLPILTADLDLLSAIYTDAPDCTNAQKYVFRYNGVWMYSEPTVLDNVDLSGGRVEYIAYDKVGGYESLTRGGRYWISIRDKIDLLGECLMALTHNTNSHQIIQDIYNAFGTGALFKMERATYGMSLPYTYDEGILTSIENAAMLPDILMMPKYAHSTRELVAGEATIKYDGASKNFWAEKFNVPLQFHKDGTSVGTQDISNALRFHPMLESHATSQDLWIAPIDSRSFHYGDNYAYNMFRLGAYCGTTIVTGFEVAYYCHHYHEDFPNALEGWNIWKVNCKAYVNKDGPNVQTLVRMGDFAYLPPIVFVGDFAITPSSTGETWDTVNIRYDWYTARRDTEVTIDKSLLINWFRGTTEYLWNSATMYSASGQRKSIG